MFSIRRDREVAKPEEHTPLFSESKSASLTELGSCSHVTWFHATFFLVNLFAGMSMACLATPAPYILSDFQAEFELNNTVASLFTTAPIIGSIAGVLWGGNLGDVYGRNKAIRVLLVALVSTNLLALAIPAGPCYLCAWAMIVLRIILGIPYGGLMVLQTTYLIEFFPDASRAGIAILAGGLNWQLATVYSINMVDKIQAGGGNWRSVVALTPVGPSVIALIGMACMPESPRWLLVAGRKEECKKAMDWIYSWPPMFATSNMRSAPEVYMQDHHHRTTAKPQLVSTLLRIFNSEFCWTTILCSAIYFFLASANNAIWAWGPELYELVDGNNPTLVFQYAEYSGMLGLFVACFTIECVGRRVFMSLAFMWEALAVGSIVVVSAGGHAQAVSTLWVARHFGSSIAWSSAGLYMSEVFPTEIRGTATGFVLTFGRIASVLAPAGMGSLIFRDWAMLGLLYCSFSFAIASLLAIVLPAETGNRALQDELCEAA